MNCIFCYTGLYPDSVYVTDGKVCVCSMCAARHSLYETAIFFGNNQVSSQLILHRPSVIDYSLNVQTAEDAEDAEGAEDTEDAEFTIDNEPGESTDESRKAYANNPINAEYGKAAVSGLNVQTKVQARIPNCPLGDCDNCHFYYGELDSCMVGEPGAVPNSEDIAKVRAALGEEEAAHFFDVDPEVEEQYAKDDERAKTFEELSHDIDNMSHDDFFSKYVDNPDALHAYVNANGEPADVFLNN